MKEELPDISKEISTNSRVLRITIILETEKPIKLSEVLDKIPLSYLKDKEFSQEENHVTIEDVINIVLKEGENRILIFSDEVYPIEKFKENIDKEIETLKKFIEFEVKKFYIREIQVESFTTDNLLNLLINKDFVDEGMKAENFEATSFSKAGSTHIRYISPFDYLKRKIREELYPPTTLMRRRISRFQILSALEKVETSLFYYHITISGEYSYVKNKLDKLSNSVKLTNIPPKTSTEELARIIKKEVKNEHEAYYIEKLLREYEERSSRTRYEGFY